MRKMIATAAIAAGLAMLTGCGGDSDAGAPTAEENAQLNEAAEMLDTSPDSLVADEEAPLGNGEEEVVEGEETGNAAPANMTTNAQ